MHHLLKDHAARIAILGAGGMGKSSLALAALHQEAIVAKFESHRYFISCEGANSSADLISFVALYFGVTAHSQLLKAIILCLSSISGPVLLVLDNLETAWEPTDGREQVENFLSLLTDVHNLHLVVSPLFTQFAGLIQYYFLYNRSQCEVLKDQDKYNGHIPSFHH